MRTRGRKPADGVGARSWRATPHERLGDFRTYPLVACADVGVSAGGPRRTRGFVCASCAGTSNGVGARLSRATPQERRGDFRTYPLVACADVGVSAGCRQRTRGVPASCAGTSNGVEARLLRATPQERPDDR